MVSTASYADAWVPFVSLWREFCGERPLTLVSDIGNAAEIAAQIAARGVEVLGLPRDYGWCLNLAEGVVRTALAHPEDAAVLVLQEDFLINATPDLVALDALDAFFAAHPSVGAVRLYPCPGPVDETPVATLGSYHLGEIHPGEFYRVSCQATAWRRECLMEVLWRVATQAPRASATDFEICGMGLPTKWRVLGVLRSATRWPIAYYCSAISRGEWEPDAVAFLAARGITVDPRRKVRG